MADNILAPKKFCKKCRAETEWYASGCCKVCRGVSSARWRSENAEKVKSTVKEYAVAHPEKAKAAREKYLAAHPEATKIAGAKWRAKNPEKAKAKVIKWRAENQEKARSAVARWAENNRDKARAATKRWSIANPEKIKTSMAKWKLENSDRIKANKAAWQTKNLEVGRIYSHNRRARVAKNGGTLSVGLADLLFKLQKGKCPCCGLALGDNYHLDHKMPLALGGSNTDDNMQLLRSVCNLQKHTKHPVEFMQSKGFLL